MDLARNLIGRIKIQKNVVRSEHAQHYEAG